MSKDTPHYTGHRERLKKRFKEVGAAGMADYELLEMLLFYVNARADVKPLAKSLLQEFKDFSHLLHADDARLKKHNGIGDTTITLLRVVQAIHERTLKNTIYKQHVFQHWDDVIAYCKESSAFKNKEGMYTLFLDNKAKLIRDEKLYTGTVDQVHGYPREIIKRALDLGASAFILVHNHTSGDVLPSQSDIDFTRELAQAAQTLDVSLQDHIIMGKNGYFSFQEKGLLKFS